MKSKRIEKPSLKFLLSLKHGQKVIVSINGTETEGIINANEIFNTKEAIFICQNDIMGSFANDLMGKKYSYCITSEDDECFVDWILLNEEEIENTSNKSNEYIKSGDMKSKRIENPSVEFLLSLKHGQKVIVSINGTETEGIINANESYRLKEAIFICQDLKEGSYANDTMGKKYSWCVFDGNNFLIDWIELIEEEPQSPKEGDKYFIEPGQESATFKLNDISEWKIIGSENSVVIQVDEVIEFDDFDMLAIDYINLLMKKK